MEKLVSVIIPAFAAEKTIKKCVKSVLSQTYANLEIIVVYKQSSDNTLNILQSFNDKRIKFIEQTANTGPGGARNIGVQNANGEWVGFVEADDVIDKDFYKNLLSAADDETDIVCGNIMLNGRKWVWFEKERVFRSFGEKFGSMKNGATFDKIFRKSLLDRHKIECSEKIRWEDNIFIFKAFYFANKIKAVPNAVYYYNAAPWSPEYRSKLQNDVIAEAAEIVRFVKDSGFSYFQKKLAYKKIIASFAGGFLDVPEIYSELMKMMNNPWFLIKKHLKCKFKKFKKNFSKRKTQ